MIIGVAGRNGAGKGEVIKLLQERSFTAHSLSDAIRDVLRERGQAESRELMIDTGRSLREEGGPGVLAERLLSMMRPNGNFAVDSVRHPAEAEALRESGRPFWLLWVDADEALRFERIRSRGRSGDPETLEELQELEGRELGSENPAAQQLLAVRGIADAHVDNSGDLEHLRAQLDVALASSPLA
jgi:dephospho-CoA kinase